MTYQACHFKKLFQACHLLKKKIYQGKFNSTQFIEPTYRNTVLGKWIGQVPTFKINRHKVYYNIQGFSKIN